MVWRALKGRRVAAICVLCFAACAAVVEALVVCFPRGFRWRGGLLN